MICERARKGKGRKKRDQIALDFLRDEDLVSKGSRTIFFEKKNSFWKGSTNRQFPISIRSRLLESRRNSLVETELVEVSSSENLWDSSFSSSVG